MKQGGGRGRGREENARPHRSLQPSLETGIRHRERTSGCGSAGAEAVPCAAQGGLCSRRPSVAQRHCSRWGRGGDRRLPGRRLSAVTGDRRLDQPAGASGAISMAPGQHAQAQKSGSGAPEPVLAATAACRRSPAAAPALLPASFMPAVPPPCAASAVQDLPDAKKSKMTSNNGGPEAAGGLLCVAPQRRRRRFGWRRLCVSKDGGRRTGVLLALLCMHLLVQTPLALLLVCLLPRAQPLLPRQRCRTRAPLRPPPSFLHPQRRQTGRLRWRLTKTCTRARWARGWRTLRVCAACCVRAGRFANVLAPAGARWRASSSAQRST